MLEQIQEWLLDWRDDAELWCRAKSPYWRGGVTLYLLYAGLQHLFGATEYSDWFKGITLAFHEMGHILFIPFGRTMTILGGSITQLVVPVIATLYLIIRQRDYFGGVFGTCWVAFSSWDLALYVGDARTENLPLVSMGSGHPEHDWSTLLTQWHVLNHDTKFAFGIRVIATLLWLASMGIAVWLLNTMRKSPEKNLLE
jgi:hypothetical protein